MRANLATQQISSLPNKFALPTLQAVSSLRCHVLGRRLDRKCAIKEITGRMIGLEPRAVQEKIVDFIGENELFDVHITHAKPRDEIHRLREINVAIVVTMNKEHWRLPGIDRSDR